LPRIRNTGCKIASPRKNHAVFSKLFSLRSGRRQTQLEARRTAQIRGETVVAGVVETHAATHREELLSPDGVFPRRKIEYRNNLREMDGRQASSAAASVVLVDDWRTTNIPGASTATSAYEDLQEFWPQKSTCCPRSTIQHIDSIRPVVSSITAHRAASTVPTGSPDRLGNLSWWDLTPKPCNRMNAGDVYSFRKLNASLKNFFRPWSTSLCPTATRPASARFV